jgi:leucyl aminopeptidase
MQDWLLDSKPANAIPLILVAADTFPQWLQNQDAAWRRWLETTDFQAKPNSISLIPGRDGALTAVIAGITCLDDPWAGGGLPTALPAGSYYLDTERGSMALERIAVGWGLGAYQFTRYKAPRQIPAKLVLDSLWDGQSIRHQVQAITLVRDLINVPAEDMMPEQLGETMLALGQEFGAMVTQVAGDELLAQNYPLIHAVGRASAHAPRLLELRWGDAGRPQLTLAGRGASSMITGSPPITVMWWMRASGLTPSALRPFSLTTITPLAPSQIWLALAAVMYPPSRSSLTPAMPS